MRAARVNELAGIELSTCPFCDSDRLEIAFPAHRTNPDRRTRGTVTISCRRCGARGPSKAAEAGAPPEAAAVLWNRRPAVDHAAVVELNRHLRRLVAGLPGPRHPNVSRRCSCDFDPDANPRLGHAPDCPCYVDDETLRGLL